MEPAGGVEDPPARAGVVGDDAAHDVLSRPVRAAGRRRCASEGMQSAVPVDDVAAFDGSGWRGGTGLGGEDRQREDRGRDRGDGSTRRQTENDG